MSAPLTIAVTGLHRGDNPQPGGAVIRSLRRAVPDIRVIGLSYDPMESGLYSHDIDKVDAAYLLPFPGKGPDALRERIFQILERERFQVLIPCLDSELANFISIHSDLKDKGVDALLPTATAYAMRAKENLAGFCQRNDIPSPKTFAANDAFELARYAEEIGYPVYVKGKYYEAYCVNSAAELLQRYDKIAGTWGLPVLVQEVLTGEEYDVLGLAGEPGEIIGYCAIRKLLRTNGGKAFAGIVVDDAQMMHFVRKIVRELRWSGPFEMEFLKANGRPHALFEINPRFPAWTDFPSQLGCNLPACLLDMLLGKKTPSLKQCDAGKMFIRHSLDLVADFAELAMLSSEGEYRAGSLEAAE